jgi:hypothetical protein
LASSAPHAVSRAKKKESPITVIGAIVANLVIAVAKFVAAAFSGSSAMLAEGIHSVVDTGNEVLLLVGLRRSVKPADPCRVPGDETHPDRGPAHRGTRGRFGGVCAGGAALTCARVAERAATDSQLTGR